MRRKLTSVFLLLLAPAVGAGLWLRSQRAESRVAKAQHPDVPIAGATEEERRDFASGNVLFDAPAHEVDGLGPLYVRSSCGACHDEALRGPGSVQKSPLRFGTSVRPLVAGGGRTPVVADGATSTRMGPPLLARGWIEAVSDMELERVEREQSERKGAIRGRLAKVRERGEPAIGRFGLKARIAALEEFVADALQGDMGLTTSVRPTELENPDGLLDDRKLGIDVSKEGLRLRTAYVRLLAIPTREQGDQGVLFARSGCSTCHVPSLRTRADYAVRAMANRDAALYSDLLLHDMGEGLADGIAEGAAGPRDWRTAPLVGLRFLRSFLHDGRAATVEQAVLAHGGEAEESVRTFETLSESDRKTLLRFVEAL